VIEGKAAGSRQPIRTKPGHREAWNIMATPQQPDDSGMGSGTGPDSGAHPAAGTTTPVVDYDEKAPRVLRIRLAPWDVTCTVVLLILLLILATETSWPGRLFGFLGTVCDDETCGPVPFGIDMYIHPVVWGGIGAAITAAIIGPVVSILKGWYMSFWPVLAMALVMASAVTGSMLTTFSERYWL
jgi:hypothetical protein